MFSSTKYVRKSDFPMSELQKYPRAGKGKGKAHPRTGHEGPEGE